MEGWALVILIGWLVMAWFVARAAFDRGRNGVAWGAATLLVPFITIPALLILGDVHEPENGSPGE